MRTIFPEIFFGYTIFTLPFWFMIYLWGVPVLLISDDDFKEKVGFATRLKSFVNPMLIAMLMGIVLGITGWGGVKLPLGIFINY